jgi:hypothetical protein
LQIKKNCTFHLCGINALSQADVQVVKIGSRQFNQKICAQILASKVVQSAAPKFGRRGLMQIVPSLDFRDNNEILGIEPQANTVVFR